jgi:aryl-alcohol dehydrogenase-like predicted oxidoreductase
MGIIGMKTPSRGGTLKMQEALRYVLSLPVSTVIVGCDSVAQLEENGRFAREFNA